MGKKKSICRWDRERNGSPPKQVLIPGGRKCSSYGNKVLADGIKLRWTWVSRGSPQCNHTYLRKREAEGNLRTYRIRVREEIVKTEAETGVRGPRDEEHWQPPELEERRKRPPLEPLGVGIH